MLDEVGAVAWEHIDDGDFDHRVAPGLKQDYRYYSNSSLWFTTRP